MIITPKDIIQNLKPNSCKKVEVSCDICGKISLTTFQNYCNSQKKRNFSGITHCRKCATKISGKKRRGKPSWNKGLQQKRGSEHSSWKGGRYLSNDGYWMIKVKHGIARPNGWCQYRKEHIVLMERKLGRPLAQGEIVHHLDGDKTNNDINNLLLVQSHKEHRDIHHSLHIAALLLYKYGFIDFDDNTHEYVANLKLLELLGYLEVDNQQPTSENGDNVSEKVQRLDGEEPTNNPSTSEEQVIPDDIVRPTHITI